MSFVKSVKAVGVFAWVI